MLFDEQHAEQPTRELRFLLNAICQSLGPREERGLRQISCIFNVQVHSPRVHVCVQLICVAAQLA